MSDERATARPVSGWSLVASVLRWGTIVAVVAAGLGLAWALAGGASPQTHRSVLELIGDGGPDGLIAIGLLALTLVPIAALAAAAVVFARAMERRSLLITLGVLLLLLVSLVAAALLGASG